MMSVGSRTLDPQVTHLIYCFRSILAFTAVAVQQCELNHMENIRMTTLDKQLLTT